MSQRRPESDTSSSVQQFPGRPQSDVETPTGNRPAERRDAVGPDEEE